MAEISPLRRRMIEDMTVRNLAPATQRSYVHAVSRFSRYFGHSPDRLGLEDVRAYQVHLVSNGISWASLNQISARYASFTASRSVLAPFPSGSRMRVSRAGCQWFWAPTKSWHFLKPYRA